MCFQGSILQRAPNIWLWIVPWYVPSGHSPRGCFLWVSGWQGIVGEWHSARCRGMEMCQAEELLRCHQLWVVVVWSELLFLQFQLFVLEFELLVLKHKFFFKNNSNYCHILSFICVFMFQISTVNYQDHSDSHAERKFHFILSVYQRFSQRLPSHIQCLSKGRAWIVTVRMCRRISRIQMSTKGYVSVSEYLQSSNSDLP